MVHVLVKSYWWLCKNACSMSEIGRPTWRYFEPRFFINTRFTKRNNNNIVNLTKKITKRSTLEPNDQRKLTMNNNKLMHRIYERLKMQQIYHVILTVHIQLPSNPFFTILILPWHPTVVALNPLLPPSPLLHLQIISVLSVSKRNKGQTLEECKHNKTESEFCLRDFFAASGNAEIKYMLFLQN